MKSEEIKEQLIYYLDKNKKYKKEQLTKYIGQNIDKELEELELLGLIYKDSHELYSNFPNHLVQGNIHITKKDGIIKTDKAKYKVKLEDLKEVLDGDLVILQPTNIEDRGFILSRLKKILKRKTGYVVVDVRESNGLKYLEDINKRITTPILLPNYVLKDYVFGDRLLVKIGTPEYKDFYKAELVSFVCNKDDSDKDIKTILINNGFTVGHSEQSMIEVNGLPNHVREEDLIGRKDFRNLLTISIDGKYTKDRDDAFSIKILPNGNYLLIVHISAVSYYVKPGMSLWDEALEKGTSVYPLDYVEPMFPKKLSNGICSLDENVDRLAESTMIEIDKEGNIINFETVPSVINSNKACTYEDVNKILEDNEEVEDYKDIYPLLIKARDLAKILKTRMIDKGFLNFTSSDLEISKSKDGDYKFSEKHMGTSQEIIEFFMVLTDEVAALESILPMVYRVHEEPEIENVRSVVDYIKNANINIKFNSKSNTITSKHIQYLLEQIKGTDLEDIISSLFISSMKVAKYSSINIGHFALGLPSYIQITSPIRRGGDLWNQYYRVKQREGYRYTDKELNDLYNKAYILSGHLTEKEIKEEKVEKESLDLVTSRYYIKNLDQLIDARITYLTSKYINIKTKDGIKGRLSLSKDYTFDKTINGYSSKENDFKLTLGTPVVVTPDKINEDNSLVFKLKK